MSDYNILLNYDMDTEEQLENLEKITKLDNIKNYTLQRNKTLYIQNPKFNEEYLKLYNYNEEEEQKQLDDNEEMIRDESKTYTI